MDFFNAIAIFIVVWRCEYTPPTPRHLSEWVSVLYECCVLFNSFFFRFCWTLFFPSRHFIYWCGIRCLAWLVAESLCVCVCFVMHKLLPVDITAITHFCAMEFCFYFLQCSRDTHTHTLFMFTLSLGFAYVRQHVRWLFAFALALALFFRPLDTRTCAHCFMCLWLCAIKRRLHALIAEAGFF